MGKHPTYTMADVVRMAQVTVRTVCRDITFRRLRLRPPPFDGRLRPGTEILRVLRATARATTQTAERADVVCSVFVAPKDLSGNGESAEGQFSGPI